MRMATVRIMSKQFFRIFFALSVASSFQNLAWADSIARRQDCSSNCERVADLGNHQPLAAVTHTETLGTHLVSFTRADQINLPQSVNVGSSGEAQAATPSDADAGSSMPLGAKNSGSETGSNPGPRFFLLIGLGLIGVRLVIAYRSKKVKNLPADTH
jgi:hypothetical protein